MNKTNDIHGRIYSYVIRVLKVTKELSRTPEDLVIIDQITRSVTSMGANDKEADGAISIKDFIHKYSIVRKEAKETDYWLHIIADTHPHLKLRMMQLLQESNEIIKIVSAIIYNTKNNKRIDNIVNY